MAWHFHQETKHATKVSFYELAAYAIIFILLNMALVFWIGTLAVRTAAYPYSFWLVELVISGSNSIRYCDDFSVLAQKACLILRTRMSVTDPASMSPYLQAKQREFGAKMEEYDAEEINAKLRSLVDLVGLYAATNVSLIAQSRANPGQISLPPIFLELCTCLSQLDCLFKQLECRTRDKIGFIIRMSLSDYYSDENQDYEDDVLPILDETPIKEEILTKIEKATERLARVLHLANYPVNCLCFRTNCCGFAFKNVFHSHQ